MEKCIQGHSLYKKCNTMLYPYIISLSCYIVRVAMYYYYLVSRKENTHLTGQVVPGPAA